MTTKPPRQPLLWAAFAYEAGIVVGTSPWRPFWWIAATLVFIAAGAFYVPRRCWLAFPLALGTLFFVGALGIQLRASDQRPGTEILADADRSEVLVTAHVIREGVIREAGYEGVRETVDLETEKTPLVMRLAKYLPGLRLSIYSGQTQQVPAEETTTTPRIYRYGERLRFPAKLRPPRNFRNPGVVGPWNFPAGCGCNNPRTL